MKIKRKVNANTAIKADDYTKVKGLSWLAQDASILCDVCNATDDQLADTLYNYPSLRSIAQEEGRPGVIKKLVDMINVYAKGCNYGSIANVYSSEDISDNEDIYVVSVWYEVDPGHDVAAPQAAQEIFEVSATCPEDAIAQVKAEWQGPFERIDIIDVNPLTALEIDNFDNFDDIPYNY